MNEFQIASFSVASSEKQNFDAIANAILPRNRLLLVIADGVGSSLHGGDAARLAVATCVEMASSAEISDVFIEANIRISAAANSDYKQWSTTLTTCILDGGNAYVGHVGDTRIYHLRGAGIQTRTKDQTEAEKLIDEGVLSRERARRYPRKNVLLSALNGSGEYELQQSSFEIMDGDRILLLSDGLYKQVGKHEIVQLSVDNVDVAAFIDALKVMLTDRGVIDDSSVICAELRENHFNATGDVAV